MAEAAAGSGCGAVTISAASDRDALLRQVRDLRVARRVPEALALIGRMEVAYPRFSRLYQERGHCLILIGDAPAATTALKQALDISPTLPSAWDMLEQLYRMAGDTARADEAAQRLSMLKGLPPEIVGANCLLADGDLEQAENAVRDYLDRDPTNVGGLRLLARVHTEAGAREDAEALLAECLTIAPDYHAARLDYALVLLQQQKHLKARHEAERLLAHAPDNRDYLKQYAAACIGLGDHEPVIDLCARLLAEGASSAHEVADLRVWRANALKITGRAREAVDDYRASLSARPDNGVAWFGLSNLKTHRFTDDDVQQMQAAEVRPGVQDHDRIYLNFALGKAQEDRSDYAASWTHYERGNALRRLESRYRPEAAEACGKAMQRVFTPQLLSDRTGWGLDDPSPIFVLGLPRSGSTLIEQILASHSQIEGTQELIEIGRYAGELCGRDPACGLPEDADAYGHLTKDEARLLGERFLSETAAYHRTDRPFFIDKMPNNFWHIGLIHLTLPNARIIDVRREPMACCFSNLKQLFGTTNQEFTYGVEDIARHYRTYLSLMRHWDRVLPGRVLRVSYEDLVDDLEGGVRRMLDHCGLPFEAGCLTFHQTQRSIRTPSSEQVRRPIGREGLDQWRDYAPWLHPLAEALGDAVTGYRS